MDIPEPLAHPNPQAGQDWSRWPAYEAAATGLRNYWYPVQWSAEVGRKPQAVRLCGLNILVIRGADGRPYALHDRCPHRGVPLSKGRTHFPGTLSCAYHGWTYRLTDGALCAVITDGPDSALCGKVRVRTFPCEERLGLVWLFIGDRAPHPLQEQLPEELAAPPRFAVGGRIQNRAGNWRFHAENGFDEGHAKYLHRTSLWRLFKTMPAWNLVRIQRRGRWLYRVEEERHWKADFPGLGRWTNSRWWKLKPRQRQGQMLGNTGGATRNDPYIKAQDFPGFASLSLPGVLRIAYPQFIHYEFYVPIDKDSTKYVGVMVQFKTGLAKLLFYLKYILGIRWLFHGQFSAQDHAMVAATDAPPERLYRPDISLVEWRRLVAEGNPFARRAKICQESAMQEQEKDEASNAQGRGATHPQPAPASVLAPPPAPEGRLVAAGEREYFLLELGSAGGDEALPSPPRGACATSELELGGKDNDKAPLFLLHGGGPGCTGWSDFGVVTPLFAATRRCFIPDLLQYGRSSKLPIEGPMWSFHAKSMTQLLDVLSIDRADFVCNSWGGAIALCLAAQYPQRVRSLCVTGSMPVFYGPLAPLPEGARRGRNARDAYYGGEGPSPEKMRALMARLEWFNADLIPDETVQMRYGQSLDKEEMALAARSDSPRGEWQDLTAELAKVRCPTLFCWGMQDAFLTPDYPMMLARMVQRGQLHVLDACGHHLQEERPHHYFQIVQSFLDQPEPEYVEEA